MGIGLLHPSLLTTLVYRFGIPGQVAHNIHNVQANGQCFLLRRNLLTTCVDFTATRHSLCEDITLARLLVAAGHAVGFYEAGNLVTATMYSSWRETWQNWTRSLPMHDHLAGLSSLLGWLEITLVQALPLPLFCLLIACRARFHSLLQINAFLVVLRIGVLFGTSRAYLQRPWSYWVSPICDGPVALKLGLNALRRRHIWRGRVLWRGGKE
jgi:dolichol-phosphate mannosyltransferase